MATQFIKFNDIRNRLNSYFANISDTLKSSTQSQPSLAYVFQTLENYIYNLNPTTIHFKIPAINPSNFITTIKSLDASKATGLDGLSSKIFKLSADIIVPSTLRP